MPIPSRSGRARVVALALVLAAGAAPAPVRAEDPPPAAGRVLAFAPPAGKPVRFVARRMSSMKDAALAEAMRRAGMSQDRPQRGTTEFSVEAGAAPARGLRPVTIRHGRVTALVPLLQGDPVEIASDERYREIPGLQTGAATLVALGGTALEGKCSPGGWIESIAIPKTLAAKRSKELGLRGEEAEYFPAAFDADGLRAELNTLLMVVPLPLREMPLREHWSVTSEIPCMPLGVIVVVTQRLRVVRVDGDDMEVAGEGTVELRPRKASAATSSLPKPTLASHSVKTSIALSRVDGLPVRGTTELAISAEVEGMGLPRRTVDLQWQLELERVEEWPSEAEKQRGGGAR